MTQGNLKDAYQAVLARLEDYQPGTTDLVIERSLRQLEREVPAQKPRVAAFREALNGPRYLPITDDVSFDEWGAKADLAFPRFTWG